jgi:ribosomal protein S18 acetylase RimI-like enzyme
MIIRKLTPSDVSEYRKVRLEALREKPPAFSSLPEVEEKFSNDSLILRLQPSQEGFILGAFQDELTGIVRYARFDAINEKHRGFIGSLYVRPTFRQQGVARSLVNHLLEFARLENELRRIHLSVVTSQTTAIELYKSLGFRIYGTECEAFSADGKFYDEYLMELLLHTN